MKASCGFHILRMILIAGNILLLGIGVLSVALGIYVKVVINQTSDTDQDIFKGIATDAIPLSLVAIGVGLILLGLLGVFGAVRKSKFMLSIYFVVLSLLVVAQFGLVIAGLIERGHVDTVLEQAWDTYFDNVTKEYIEKQFKCCGFMDVYDSPSDYCLTNSTNTLYSQACGELLEDFVKDRLLIIIGCAVGAVLIQIVWLIFACCFCTSIKKKEDEEEGLLRDAYKTRP